MNHINSVSSQKKNLVFQNHKSHQTQESHFTKSNPTTSLIWTDPRSTEWKMQPFQKTPPSTFVIDFLGVLFIVKK